MTNFIEYAKIVSDRPIGGAHYSTVVTAPFAPARFAGNEDGRRCLRCIRPGSSRIIFSDCPTEKSPHLVAKWTVMSLVTTALSQEARQREGVRPNPGSRQTGGAKLLQYKQK